MFVLNYILKFIPLMSAVPQDNYLISGDSTFRGDNIHGGAVHTGTGAGAADSAPFWSPEVQKEIANTSESLSKIVSPDFMEDDFEFHTKAAAKASLSGAAAGIATWAASTGGKGLVVGAVVAATTYAIDWITYEDRKEEAERKRKEEWENAVKKYKEGLRSFKRGLRTTQGQLARAKVKRIAAASGQVQSIESRALVSQQGTGAVNANILLGAGSSAKTMSALLEHQEFKFGQRQASLENIQRLVDKEMSAHREQGTVRTAAADELEDALDEHEERFN